MLVAARTRRGLLRLVSTILVSVVAAATAAVAVPAADPDAVAAGGTLESHAGAGPAPLRAGVAEGLLRVPVGTPLGGYLRPPVGGEYVGDDPFGELTDWVPGQTADDGSPLLTAPDETRTAHSPFATISPPSRGYFDSFITKAVALDDGEDLVVLVKGDLIGMIDEVVVAVADRVLEATGIDVSEGLVMSASHTHGGPGALANHAVRYFWMAMDVYQPELFDRLTDDLAAVVIDALDEMVPARFGVGTGQESRERPLNSFRRSRSPWTAEEVALQDALRRRIGVLRVDEVDEAGQPVRPMAVMINYAAHGIVFGVENVMFNGDVLSAVEREVESSFDTPVTAMLVQSVGGDVSPRADGGPRLQRMERFGRLLAPQVLDIYDAIDDFDAQPAISAVSQRIALNRETLGYTGDEYPYEWGAVQCNANGPDERCLPAPPPGAWDLADNGHAENDSFVPLDTRLSAVRIGDTVLLAQPGEPLGEYGVRLLQASPFGWDRTFVWGYSQDHIGYLMPESKEDWLLGGTEGTTTFWGWKLGGRLQVAYEQLMAALAGFADAPEDELEVSYIDHPYVPAVASPSPRAGRVVTQPTDIERFAATSFSFEGGDPIVDLPRVRMERALPNGRWLPVRHRGGRIMDTFGEMQLRYRLVSGAHQWTVDFEAPLDWKADTYRFVASGSAAGVAPGETAAYEVASEPFAVAPSASLLLGEVVRDGDTVETTLAYTPRPTNYRLIDAEVPSDQPAPVRGGQATFTAGDVTVVADAPVIELRDGLEVAVYRATLPTGVPADAELTVSGTDPHANRTP
jgi:neutral ceramidase